MKRKILAVVSFLFIFALTACSNMSQQDKSYVGTGVGAVAGGVAGHALFGSTAGTVIGAAGGAVAGNVIGSHS